MDSKEETTKIDVKNTPEVNQDDHQSMDSDFALALAMQEQENTQNQQYDDVSDDNSDEYSSSVFSYDDEDYEFFENREALEDLTFIVDESAADHDMEEDEIDPDDMSYEELLALSEIVGEANRGLTDEEISTCLEISEWSCSFENKTTTDRCVVCQMEYEQGEKLVVLCRCFHTYHGDCISQWLKVKKTCPVCNTEVSPTTTSSSVGSSSPL